MTENVIIEKNSIDKTGQLLKNVKPVCKTLIVTDDGVPKEYSEKVKNSLLSQGYTVTVFTFKSGENSKSLETATKIIDELTKNNFSRSDLLIGVGGGVVGDVTGFTASVFLRGIDYCLIPTTLLACCDSAIGGKTGVNFGNLKNYIGSFHKPILVVEDVNTLSTLSSDEMLSGYGEIIKCALLCGGEFYTAIISGKDVEELIKFAVEYKTKTVENDFKEKGERIYLNFGHTVGHAIEEYSEYTIKHGVCVLYGIYYAVDYSVKKGLLPQNTANEIKTLIKKFGVDKPTEFNAEKLLELIKSDKKHYGNKVKFVCIKGIGQPCIEEVEFDGLGEIL